MCARFCANGYRNNERGCMTCDCNEEAPAAATYECPMVKCGENCASYKKDVRGCRTCECEHIQPLCGEKTCEMGEICQKRIVKFKEIETCVPKPLCLASQESAGLSHRMGRSTGDYGMFTPDCEENGEFRPIQCSAMQTECWCVDDRGHEIDGTRTPIYVDDHKPRCVRNITVALTIKMVMVIVPEDDNQNSPLSIADQLTNALPDHVGDWLLIDRQYITVLSVRKLIGGDEVGRTSMLVSLLVRHDGSSNLPSAAEHMKRLIHLGRCKVALGDRILAPKADSVQTEHKFSQVQDTLKNAPLPANKLDNGMFVENESWIGYCFNHSYPLIIAVGLCLLILMTILVLSVLIVRRRRTHQRLNLGHQRLESQMSTSSEKSLLDDRVLLVSAEPIEEKSVQA
jgi:hypothetical protein